MDRVSVIAGSFGIVALLLMWRYFRQQMAWVADVHKTHREAANKMFQQWDGTLVNLENRVDRLNQVHDIALEMQDWAKEQQDSEVEDAVNAFSSRLLSITVWEEFSYGDEQEEGEDEDDSDEEASEEGAQDSA